MGVEGGCVEFGSGGGVFGEEAADAEDSGVHWGESGVVRAGVGQAGEKTGWS